jgi:hypothetical protein
MSYLEMRQNLYEMIEEYHENSLTIGPLIISVGRKCYRELSRLVYKSLISSNGF